MRRRAALTAGSLAAGALLGLAGCRGRGTDPSTPPAFRVAAPAFADGRLPARFTCDGAGDSPPFAIDRVPSPAVGLALVATVPVSAGEQGTLWLLWDVPPDVDRIPAGVPDEPTVAALGGARQGTNAAGTIGYRPPCPPAGAEREVWFTLYALRDPLGLAPGARRDAVARRLESAQLAGRRVVVDVARPDASQSPG